MSAVANSVTVLDQIRLDRLVGTIRIARGYTVDRGLDRRRLRPRQVLRVMHGIMILSAYAPRNNPRVDRWRTSARPPPLREHDPVTAQIPSG